MPKRYRPKGIETKRRRYGYIFVTHWIIGLILFFAFPLISSVRYAFSDVSIESGAIVTQFVGLTHFKQILNVDPTYVDNFRNALVNMFYSLPIVISLSLILAVMLNQNFKGRTIVRAIFFLPVIITSSVVMNRLSGTPINLPILSTGTSGVGMIDYKGIIENLSVPTQLTTILTFLLSKTMNLVWSCGVQVILFLAGLQSIPNSLYEVSKIEGANKWEEFWYITVPSLSNVISLVMIYTMIDIFADMQNKVVSIAYGKMVSQQFGESSAMLWLYFAIVLIVIGTVFILFNRLCLKKWE